MLAPAAEGPPPAVSPGDRDPLAARPRKAIPDDCHQGIKRIWGCSESEPLPLMEDGGPQDAPTLPYPNLQLSMCFNPLCGPRQRQSAGLGRPQCSWLNGSRFDCYQDM